MTTLAERRRAALDQCNVICRLEYDKYLKATQAARDEYFKTLQQLDAEADEAIARGNKR